MFHTPIRRARGSVFIVCVYLAGIVWLVFGQTLRHPFTNFDDPTYVYQNPSVTSGLSAGWIVRAFTRPDLLLWTPLTTVSHMLDCQLYGLAPAGHHLTNVLLHTAAAILLFLVLREATGALWPSAFVAAAFAIHPLRVESVAWVAERKDVLSGVFFMLTLGAYVRYARKPGSLARYAAVALFLALGLMAKPSLVTTPFVLLLLDYWPLGRRGAARLLMEKIPLLLLSAGSCAMTLLVKGNPTGFEHVPYPIALRIGNALVSSVTYLGQTFYPASFALIYPFPPSGQPGWKVALALVLLGGISGIVFLCRKKQPWLPMGWLWYVGMLVPALGFVPIGEEAHADRYTYLPQIGIFILVAWTVAELPVPWPRRSEVLGALAVLVIAALAAIARVQTSYWRDEEILWRRTLAQTSGSTLARINLGAALRQKGRLDEATAQFQKAVERSPHFAPAHLDLASALLQGGRLDEAIFQYRKAIEIYPGFAQAHYGLGCALLQKGEADQAAMQYRLGIENKPDYVEAYNNLAYILATSPNASVRDGRQAVGLAEKGNRLTGGENPVVLSTLAAAYAETGQFTQAVETGVQAQRLARAQGNTALEALLAREIQSYQAGSPWRDPH